MPTEHQKGKISWHHYVPLDQVGKYLWDGWTISNCMFECPTHGPWSVIMTKMENIDEME